MTRAGNSLFWFGIFIFLTGLLFAVIPQSIISLMKLPEIPTNWARFIGLIVMVIGTYDMICGRWDVIPFIKASVFVRFGFALGTILFFVLGQMPATILLFGAADALGAIWTILALRSERTG